MHARFLFSSLLLLYVAGCTSTPRPGIADSTVLETRHAHRLSALQSVNPLPRMQLLQQRQVQLRDGSINVQVYSPGGTDLPVILLLPSLDFISGDLVTHDRIARTLAADTPALVVLPALPQEPEATAEMTADSALAVFHWIQGRVERWGGAPGCITLMSEGAGARNVLALAQRIRDRDGPDLAGLVLLTPAFKPSVLPAMDDLVNLPQTYILLGENDPHQEDGVQLAGRLEEAGTPIRSYTHASQGSLRLDWALADPGIYATILEAAREAQERFNACQADQASATF